MKDLDIDSYADDNTPCFVGDNIDQVVSALQNVAASLFKWFSDNQLNSNSDKCNLPINEKWILKKKLTGNMIQNIKCKQILGIKTDNKLSFKTHMEDLCKRASHKIHALARIMPKMDFPKKRILLNAFFKSQFSYCPLTWMLRSRSLNNKINALQGVSKLFIMTNGQHIRQKFSSNLVLNII